jgi:hypothetical protein
MTCVFYTCCFRLLDWGVWSRFIVAEATASNKIIVCVCNENNGCVYVPKFWCNKLFRTFSTSRSWIKITPNCNSQLNTYFDLLPLVVMATAHVCFPFCLSFCPLHLSDGSLFKQKVVFFNYKQSLIHRLSFRFMSAKCLQSA